MYTNLIKRNFSFKKVAALDAGSNSFHMTIVEVDDSGTMKIIDALKEQPRLAACFDEQGNLTEIGFSRAEVALKHMKELADKHQATVRAIGTSALREAKNGSDFVDRLFKSTGIEIEIITGEEEARLIYLGVQNGLMINEAPTLIVDVGGGSTELVVGQWGEERFLASKKLGCVRLCETFLHDPTSEEEIARLEHHIVTRLEPDIAEIKRIGFIRAVGSSGTIKALKSLSLGLQGKEAPESYHSLTLTREDLLSAVDVLLKNLSIKERKQLPGLDPKRSDIIIPGALIFRAITQMANIKEWTISLTALREGIVLDTILRAEFWLAGDVQDVRWRSVRSFGQQFQIDEAHAFHITSLAIEQFQESQEKYHLPSSWREYLRAAAYLHECGLFLGKKGFHKHSAYFLHHASLPGFTEREMHYIALIARYQRKRLPRNNDEYYKDFSKETQDAIKICAQFLRLARESSRP